MMVTKTANEQKKMMGCCWPAVLENVGDTSHYCPLHTKHPHVLVLALSVEAAVVLNEEHDCGGY